MDWHWGPVLPHVQCGFGTTRAPRAVVTVGGSYWETSSTGETVKHWLKTARLLDLTAHSWRSLPDYPHEVAYSLVVCRDTTIFSLGGRNGQGTTKETYWLDLRREQDGWRRGTDLPCPLARLRGGLDRGVIYAFSDELPGDSANQKYRHRVLSLDTTRPGSEWAVIADLPEPNVSYRSGVVCGGHLFVFGGGEPQADGSIQLSTTAAALNLKQRTWRPIRTLPCGLRDASTAAVGERFVLLTGGVEQPAKPSTTPNGKERIILTSRNWLYDIQRDAYLQVSPLRLAVADHGLAIIGTTVVIVGGEDSPYRSRTDLVQIGELPRVVGSTDAAPKRAGIELRRSE